MDIRDRYHVVALPSLVDELDLADRRTLVRSQPKSDHGRGLSDGHRRADGDLVSRAKHARVTS